jgi:hypothetical protein
MWRTGQAMTGGRIADLIENMGAARKLTTGENNR